MKLRILFVAILLTASAFAQTGILGPILLGTPAAGGTTVTFDAVASNKTSAAGTSIPNFTLTIGGGVTNGAVLVGVGFDKGTSVSAITVTVGGSSATQLVTTNDLDNSRAAMFCFLSGASTGAKTISISWTGSADASAGAISFSNVNQGSACSGWNNGVGHSVSTGPCSVTVTSATNDLVLDTCAAESGSASSPTGTQRWVFGSTSGSSNGSTTAGAASVNPQWTTSSGWSDVGVDIPHS